MDDVLVVELAHDAGLAQEVLPLLLHVARLQRLYGHSHIAASRLLQNATDHLAKLACAQKANVRD